MSFIRATIGVTEMERSEEFLRYIKHIGDALGGLERREALNRHCKGLMLPLKRKSPESLVASIDLLRCAKKTGCLSNRRRANRS